MLIFNRSVTLKGNPRDTLAWAGQMTAFVNDNTELSVSLWQTSFGAPIGTVSWSTMAESRAVLDAAFSELAGSSDYFDLIDAAQDFVGEPGTDTLREVVHSAGPEYSRAPIGSIVSLITAKVANGQYDKAALWSVEMTDLVSGITGAPSLLCRDLHGAFGQITWISQFPSMGAVDAADEAVNKEPAYLERLGRAGELFVEGSGQQGLARRIA